MEYDPLSRRLNFPLFGVVWTAEDTIIVAGGGGSMKSGVKNKYVVPNIARIIICLNLLFGCLRASPFALFLYNDDTLAHIIQQTSGYAKAELYCRRLPTVLILYIRY